LIGGTKYNVHVVDQKSNMGWVAHVVQKNAVPKILENHCEFLKGRGLDVNKLSCDNNAGEHQTKLKKICEKKGIDLEYTPPYTPQMNGVVERRI
jgi:transposase InsO family protein